MISYSILQSFRSWVDIFFFAILPRFYLIVDTICKVLFLLWLFFPGATRQSNKQLIPGWSWNAWNRLWTSSITCIWSIQGSYEVLLSRREKGRDLTQSCDKNPYIHRTIQKATWQHKNATKNFDYTTIADRLRTVGWRNSSHPTGVVKPVNECLTLSLTAKAV